jgi:hypothetical protein
MNYIQLLSFNTKSTNVNFSKNHLENELPHPNSGISKPERSGGTFYSLPVNRKKDPLKWPWGLGSGLGKSLIQKENLVF